VTLQAVIFDVDGTLIDSVDQHALAWLKTFRRWKVYPTFEAVRGQIGKGGDQMMPVFLPTEVVEREGEAIEQFRHDIFEREFLPGVQAFPEVPALFERVRRDRRKTVLASSAKGDELERYKEIAGISDLIEEATSADDAERSKPFPDIFLAALEAASVRADEAVVIGDTPYDAEAAVKAGVRPIGVLCGGFPEADLRAAGCIAIYRDPAHLLAEYDRSPLAG
jgi:HAD superfamily hydrolase (TIGR01509 family)